VSYVSGEADAGAKDALGGKVREKLASWMGRGTWKFQPGIARLGSA